MTARCGVSVTKDVKIVSATISVTVWKDMSLSITATAEPTPRVSSVALKAEFSLSGLLKAHIILPKCCLKERRFICDKWSAF